MDKKGEYNISKAIQVQQKLCRERNFPHFAPEDGRCWCCNKNIYEEIGWKYDSASHRHVQVPLDSDQVGFTTGITVEKAGEEFITGCPHCSRTYCD
ncbi:hypothetical protein CLROS_017750 [Clostridium felsineum]|uniref:Uncharacterized protein n=2 Tax=Clostridium felsineum TaxID=36839 RepID=A0A1S8KZU8_9CLOT|nr:hypothetical protein CLROS_017750 [Clostridium felsineum]URZ11477.1 hypothetical protein CROST_021940 [Clostridium felsineum]